MNFKEYIDQAAVTAVYPQRGTYNGLDYCVCGLVGEVGECFNVLKKCIRDDDWGLTDKKIKKFIQECGGISWYLSQILFEIRVKTPDLDKDLLEYQENLVRKFKKDQDININDIDNKIKKMKHILSAACIKSANILNICNNLELIELDDNNIDKCIKEIGKLTFEVLNSIIIFSDVIGVNYIDILKENIKLLTKRKEADTLKGSGDGVEGRD